MMVSDLCIVSFNVRGIRDVTKRRSVFRYFHVHFPNSIVIVQETHSAQNDEKYWRNEWGGDIYFNHGPTTQERGVAALIPKNFAGRVTLTEREHDGRILTLNLSMDSVTTRLIGVYLPVQNRAQQPIDCLELIGEILSVSESDSHENVILCGDFNIHCSALDIHNRNFRLTGPAKVLVDILERFELRDVWRDRNPDVRAYTWRRLNPFQQSRIDYIFMSDTLVQHSVVNRSSIEPSIHSDHNIVSIQMRLTSSDHGPGLWRFNNSLLLDEEFVNDARGEINKAVLGCDIYSQTSDLGLKLEMLTSQIRTVCIFRSKKKAADRRAEENDLLHSIRQCESRLAANPSAQDQTLYAELKRKLDVMEEEKGRFAMIRSGAKWVEDGEKPSKYFLSLCSKRASEKMIDVLETPDGQNITGKENILKYCKSHFADLYTTVGDESIAHEVRAEWTNLVCPKLNTEDQEQCDGPITNDECRIALSAMMNNKSPSVSGFTKEFFLHFWPEIGDFIVSYINSAKEDQFFITQRRGILCLLPKKGKNQKLIKNKRPICLLDVIYKIAAKVIATRLSRVIDKLVSVDQTGGIRGRFIGENTRLISDVIEYCRKDELSGILLALDFRNAYNTVEHSFLLHALRLFNFGESFIRWVQFLHRNMELAVIVNGYTSQWFRPSRGPSTRLSRIKFVVCVSRGVNGHQNSSFARCLWHYGQWCKRQNNTVRRRYFYFCKGLEVLSGRERYS